VQKAAVNHTMRMVGRIAPDEKRVYRLVAGLTAGSGNLRQRHRTLVKKDERLPLFTVPVRAAQLSYIALVGAGGEDRFAVGGRTGLAPSQQASVSLQTYIDALESLGMSQQQIKELAKTKQLTDKVSSSPGDRLIIARNVSAGQQLRRVPNGIASPT